ncbi:unnamed protein product [Brassicogethes aeneus]|uniref:UDP-N-acetylglucosamine diphosphorylase n=1 Tax=Brassicogethes aeneus TaxID=1431903 RepID=A0A9P0AXN1_BRAAE|nr:unnamed protein product [Brassicogethes aeneus]
MSSSLNEIKEKLNGYNQQQLLATWELLDREKQLGFVKHVNAIDFEEANFLFKKAKQSMESDIKKLDDFMTPVPATQYQSEEKVCAKTLDEYRSIGLEAISNNEVAVLLLAGGQGTRLGSDNPKGMFSVGLPSGKTLFQIQAERIRRVTALAKEKYGKFGTIPWYIMTSGPTDRTTHKFLVAKNYFDLNEKDVILFQQGLLPCYDFEGKILLNEKDHVAFAPDGNGGIYKALAKHGILNDMEKRGVKYVHVHSVDNILVKVADPVFIGYCVSKQAECGAKVVKKANPNEPVGVICQVDGKYQVVEYSEITEKTALLKNENGDLKFNAGNICNHFFSTSFLRKVVNECLNDIKVHVAIKKIPYTNALGKKVTPVEANGIKIEKFIFDVFQFAEKFVIWEVPRNEEFSALKNSDEAGKDCPMTARNDLLALHRAYVEKAGGRIEAGEVEISPLLSYAGENLENIVKGVTYNNKGAIQLLPENKLNGVNGKH